MTETDFCESTLNQPVRVDSLHVSRTCNSSKWWIRFHQRTFAWSNQFEPIEFIASCRRQSVMSYVCFDKSIKKNNKFQFESKRSCSKRRCRRIREFTKKTIETKWILLKIDSLSHRFAGCHCLRIRRRPNGNNPIRCDCITFVSFVIVFVCHSCIFENVCHSFATRSTTARSTTLLLVGSCGRKCYTLAKPASAVSVCRTMDKSWARISLNKLNSITLWLNNVNWIVILIYVRFGRRLVSVSTWSAHPNTIRD